VDKDKKVIFEVTTTDNDAVLIEHCIAGDEWHPDAAVYMRNRHVLQSMRKVNTPNRTLMVSCYYLFDPETGIFVFQGFASGELAGFRFCVEVVGNIERLDEGGRNVDSLNRATITLGNIES